MLIVKIVCIRKYCVWQVEVFLMLLQGVHIFSYYGGLNGW